MCVRSQRGLEARRRILSSALSRLLLSAAAAADLVALDRPLRPGTAAAFASGGMQLADGSVTRPVRLEPHAAHPHVCTVTLGEGRYHQIRRMFAECGHGVTAIHRVAVAGLRLDALGLPQGAWRLLSEAELLAALEASQPVAAVPAAAPAAAARGGAGRHSPRGVAPQSRRAGRATG